MLTNLIKYAILMISLTVARSAFSQQKLTTDSVRIGGDIRQFQYDIPEGITSNPSLVFVLHASGGSPERVRFFTNYEFERLADTRKNFILVYPAGYKNYWNDCRVNASYAASQEDIDDISFFSQMIDYFVENHQVDPGSVFATGISNGGQMCYRLAYELPGSFKGIAPCIANLPEPAFSKCTPSGVPASMMIINGTDDPINPNEGGWVVVNGDSTRGKVIATEESFEYWVNLMPCKPEMQELNYEDINQMDGTTVKHTKYACADSEHKVELVSVINGGHTIPLINTPDKLSQAISQYGGLNHDVNSLRLIIEFFESLR